MKKIRLKKISLFLCVNIFILTFSTAIAAEGSEAIENLETGTGVYATLYNLVGIMVWVGIMLCIAKLMHIGIKFITQPAGGRSNAKESLLPWFVGILVLATFWSLGPWLIDAIAPESSSSEGTGIFDI